MIYEQYIFPPAVYPLETFIKPTPSREDNPRTVGAGPASFKPQPWHKSRERKPKKKGRQRSAWAPKGGFVPTTADRAKLTAQEESPPPLPNVKVNKYGEPVYDWPVPDVRLPPVKPDRAEPTGSMRRDSTGAMTAFAQFSTFSGAHLRERIKGLGFTGTSFANRTGVPSGAIYALGRRAAGRVPLMYQRLIEFEEFMACVALAVDETPNRDLRERLTALLSAQVARIP